jgi:hypothetical protein
VLGVLNEGLGLGIFLSPVKEQLARFFGALIGPGEPAICIYPLDLLVEEEDGRKRWGIERLVLARVIERKLQREDVGDVAVRACYLLDPLDRFWRDHC